MSSKVTGLGASRSTFLLARREFSLVLGKWNSISVEHCNRSNLRPEATLPTTCNCLKVYLKWASCDSQGNEWIYWRVLRKTQLFFFLDHKFWKKRTLKRELSLQLNFFKICCLEMTMTDLCKIGLKMREWRLRELSSYISKQEQGHVPHSTTPFPPGSSCWAKIKGGHWYREKIFQHFRMF